MFSESRPGLRAASYYAHSVELQENESRVRWVDLVKIGDWLRRWAVAKAKVRSGPVCPSVPVLKSGVATLEV